MNQTENTVRPGSVMYTPRTPRMRQRQRFDLSTKPEEDEIDGLEGTTFFFISEKENLKSVLITMELIYYKSFSS